MEHYTKSELESLIVRFEARKLPRVEWTHEAHLAVAIWYCTNHSFDIALNLVRDFITNHNASVGTQNTDAEGYHESITKFWLLTANQFLNNNSFELITEAANAFIFSEFADSSFPLTYYSREVLFSVKARLNWIEPDLKSLTL